MSVLRLCMTAAVLLCACNGLQAERVVLMPVESAINVTPQEAQSYYLSLMEVLSARKELQVVERDQLKRVLDERDLAAALTPQDADKVYVASAGKLSAKEVLVPAICKINDDFLLTLREVSVETGLTRKYALDRQRVVSKFSQQAAKLVDEVFGKPGLADQPATTAVAADVLADLCEQCRLAKAPELFPAMWQRCQKLAEASKEPALLAEYYMGLLQLSIRAANPPQGMVFIPGGYVSVDTSAGSKKLWVEPFFMDRCEVSIAAYNKFLAETRSDREIQAIKGLNPITRSDKRFNQDDLPATGISHHAAAAYAGHNRKALPTRLQWLRAASGDDARTYPCGGDDALAACNLKGSQDGYEALAPAHTSSGDVGPYGAVGMTGNVREWTASWESKDAYTRCPADAPVEVADGTMRLVMGGSWRTAGQQALCGHVDACKPAEATDDIGFRCVQPLKLFPGGQGGILSGMTTTLPMSRRAEHD